MITPSYVMQFENFFYMYMYWQSNCTSENFRLYTYTTRHSSCINFYFQNNTLLFTFHFYFRIYVILKYTISKYFHLPIFNGFTRVALFSIQFYSFWTNFRMLLVYHLSMSVCVFHTFRGRYSKLNFSQLRTKLNFAWISVYKNFLYIAKQVVLLYCNFYEMHHSNI